MTVRPSSHQHMSGCTLKGQRFNARYKRTDARIDHQCETCGERIARGSAYNLVQAFMLVRVCDDCLTNSAVSLT